jgi:hypothetical protein
MARLVSWLPRLHLIRRTVANSVRSHYDRRDLELLFKLQPRAAGKLLEMLPTEAMGRSHLVTREALLRFLEQASEAEDVAALVLRQRQDKEAVSRRKPRSLVRRDLDPVGMAALPSWITLTPGRLEVNFETTEQLGEGMLILARILETEGDEFAAAYEPPLPPSDVPAATAEVRAMFRELEQMEVSRGR